MTQSVRLVTATLSQTTYFLVTPKHQPILPKMNFIKGNRMSFPAILLGNIFFLSFQKMLLNCVERNSCPAGVTKKFDSSMKLELNLSPYFPKS